MVGLQPDAELGRRVIRGTQPQILGQELREDARYGQRQAKALVPGIQARGWRYLAVSRARLDVEKQGGGPAVTAVEGLSATGGSRSAEATGTPSRASSPAVRAASSVLGPFPARFFHDMPGAT